MEIMECEYLGGKYVTKVQTEVTCAPESKSSLNPSELPIKEKYICPYFACIFKRANKF